MSPASPWPSSLLTDRERKIVKTVVDRFLNLNEGTSQKALEVQYQDPDAVARLSRYSLITHPLSDQKLFPTSLGFQLCGDTAQINQVRSALEIVLHTLRNLFEVEIDKQDFTFADIETHARKLYDSATEESLRLGLYLATEFPVFSNYSGAVSKIERVGISNQILKIKDIGTVWDRHIRSRQQYLEERRAPQGRDRFLANLGRLNGPDRQIDRAQVERVAFGSSFQHDEIGQLLEACESEGLLARDPKVDTFTLTDTALIRARMNEGRKAWVGEEDSAVARTVFVVHGRNEGIKETVARFLENLELEVVILHEKPNQGQTLIEKFEVHSNVGFAVVLLTPDDSGGPASEPNNFRPRARQNVILELGFFIGKLGRERVCPIIVEGVETPSDIHGVVYVPYDPNGAWRLTLAKEIRAAGIEVDLNRIA